jgi:hypothetical protein
MNQGKYIFAQLTDFLNATIKQSGMEPKTGQVGYTPQKGQTIIK